MSNRFLNNMPQIVTINVEAVEMTTKFKINKSKRSNSVDNLKKKGVKKFKSFSCSNINYYFDSSSLKPVYNSNSKFETQNCLLTLPKNIIGMSSNSKLSLNCMLTPNGSIFDVSDTNSMIFKNDNEVCVEDNQQFLSKFKLSQLDEQVATDYKLKCKNWLKNFIDSSS